MIIPYGDPGKGLVTSHQVQISPVLRNAPAVVVETINLLVGLRNSTERVAPSVVAVLILVNVVAKVDHVVDRVLAHRVAVGIEETKGLDRRQRTSPQTMLC